MTLPFSTSTINRAEAAQKKYFSSLIAKGSGSRPTDNLTGKEVVTRSSKRPIVVNPLLGTSPMELSEHRAETHVRVAHKVSNSIALVTGALDGITDGVINGTGELVENGVFLVSKVAHGVKHGWERGKFPTNRDQ